MTADQVKRKLAAILSADVKGYSRLMGEDEEGTIRALKVHLEIISGFIRQHQGRVVGTAGDSVLAEFASVVDAIRCAVAIQGELAERNRVLEADRRLEFRIGVNLGDVVDEGDTILGDGVNIAARLESLSEPGGICISGTAFDQVKNKLNLGYKYLGEQKVKNIKESVRVYQVLMDPESAGKVIGERKAISGKWPKAAIGLAAVLIVALGVAVLWKYFGPSGPQLESASKAKVFVTPAEKIPKTDPATQAPSFASALSENETPPAPEKATQPAPPPVPKMEVADNKKLAFTLPEEPSIAVLPFVNMSGDPKQEFLGDGITEEIITALSKVRHLFVISRQSTFSYKGKPVKVKQVSEELGVRYVLEGSVQRSEDRIRINSQLIDAFTGRNIWTERYNRKLTDLFAVQDDITTKILSAIQVKLTEGEQIVTGYEKFFKGKNGLDCYLKYLDGTRTLQDFTPGSIMAARRIADEAMEMCPQNPMIYFLASWVTYVEFWMGLGKSPKESIEKGIEWAQKGLAIDDSSSLGHSLLSLFYSLRKENEKAISEGERAVALEPGSANRYMVLGMNLRDAGRSEEAISPLQKAIRLNPIGTSLNFLHLGHAYRDTGRLEESVSEYKKALQRAPKNLFAYIGLSDSYIRMGREEEARAAAAEILRIDPKFSLDSYAKRISQMKQSYVDRHIESLRKAGLK